MPCGTWPTIDFVQPASQSLILPRRGATLAYAMIELALVSPSIGSLPASLVPHFLETFAARGGLTLHLVGSGRDDHHLAEAGFKAVARALRQGCAIDATLADRSASTK